MSNFNFKSGGKIVFKDSIVGDGTYVDKRVKISCIDDRILIDNLENLLLLYSEKYPEDYREREKIKEAVSCAKQNKKSRLKDVVCGFNKFTVKVISESLVKVASEYLLGLRNT